MTPDATVVTTTRETQGDVEPADIGELVTDAAPNHTPASNENPY